MRPRASCGGSKPSPRDELSRPRRAGSVEVELRGIMVLRVRGRVESGSGVRGRPGDPPSAGPMSAGTSMRSPKNGPAAIAAVVSGELNLWDGLARFLKQAGFSDTCRTQLCG